MATVEELQKQLGERDATIVLLKEKTKSYIEKLNSDHATALATEATARQTLEGKLEAAKPVFLKLKDDNAQLAAQVESLKVVAASAAAASKPQSSSSSAEVEEYKRKTIEAQSSIADMEEMMRNLKQQYSTNAANGTEEQAALRQQLASSEQSYKQLAQELAAVRAAAEVESHARATTASASVEVAEAASLKLSEAVQKGEELAQQLSASKKELLTTCASLEVAVKERDAAAGRVTSLEQSLQQAQAGSAAAKEQSSLAQSQVKKDGDEIAALKKQLVELSAAKASGDKRVSDLEAQLTTAVAAAKAAADQQSADGQVAASRISDLETRLAEATKKATNGAADRASQDKEMAETLRRRAAEAEEALRTARAEWTAEKAALEGRLGDSQESVESLRRGCEEAEGRVRTLQESIESIGQRAIEGQRAATDSGAAAAATGEKLAQLQNELSAAQSELTTARSASEEQLAAWARSKEEYDSRITRLETALTQLKSAHAEALRAVSDGGEGMKEQAAVLTERVVELEGQVVAIHESLQSSQDLLQQANSAAESARQSVDAANAALALVEADRASATARCIQLETQLQQTSTALAQAQQELAQLSTDRADAGSRVDATRAERDAAVLRIGHLEGELESALGALEAAQEAAQTAQSTSTAGAAAAHERDLAVQQALALGTQVEQLTAQLADAEGKMRAAAEAHAVSLRTTEETIKKVTQDKLDSAKSLFMQMKATNEVLTATEADLTQQLAQAHAQVQLLTDQCARAHHDLATLSHGKSEAVTQLELLVSQKDTQLAELVVVRSEHEALVQIQQADAATIASITHQLHALEESFNHKLSELNTAQVALTASTTAHTTLHAQHQHLKTTHEQTLAQLDNERKEIQDQRQKVRTYVDTLNAEKDSLEAEKSALLEAHQISLQRIATLEALLAKEEQKLVHAKETASMDVEQIQKDCDRKMSALQDVLTAKITENEAIQHQLDQHAATSAEEVLAARMKVELSGRELEEYKAKRLVARNEMIGAAHALERAQKEGAEMKQFIQYSLAPLVFEQVSALEMLLSAVEYSSSQLSAKRMIQLHNTATDFLARRLGDGDARRHADGLAGASDHSSTALGPLALRVGDGSNDSQEDLKGSFPGGGTLGGTLGGTVASGETGKQFSHPRSAGAPPSPFTEALEQAEVLRRELTKVHAGLALLSGSVERLGDVINVDTRCCGGMFQLFSSTVGGTIEGRIRGSIVGRTLASHSGGVARVGAVTRGYATVGSGDEARPRTRLATERPSGGDTIGSNNSSNTCDSSTGNCTAFSIFNKEDDEDD